MRALITCIIIFVALNINAQEFFSATGVEVGDSDHISFMKKHKSEIEKRASLWKVPTKAVQVIASVQSGGGILEGFNYGAVLPAPAITKYPKFSKTDDFDLVACSKPSRGFEVIAIALNAMRQQSGMELNTAQDFLNYIFGAGGELSIMASEAEKAYSAYTGKQLSINPSYSAPAASPVYSSPESTSPNLILDSKPNKETVATETVAPEVPNTEVEMKEAVEAEVPVIEEIVEEIVKTDAQVEDVKKEKTKVVRPEKKSSGIVTYSDALNSIKAKKEEEEQKASGKTIFVAETIEDEVPSAPKEKEEDIAKIETYQSTGVIRKEKEKKTDIEALLAEYRSEGHSEEDVAKYKVKLEQEDKMTQSKIKQQALREEAKKEEAKRAAQIERAEKIIMQQREEARKAREKKKKEGGN